MPDKATDAYAAATVALAGELAASAATLTAQRATNRAACKMLLKQELLSPEQVERVNKAYPAMFKPRASKDEAVTV